MSRTSGKIGGNGIMAAESVSDVKVICILSGMANPKPSLTLSPSQDRESIHLNGSMPIPLRAVSVKTSRKRYPLDLSSTRHHSTKGCMSWPQESCSRLKFFGIDGKLGDRQLITPKAKSRPLGSVTK